MTGFEIVGTDNVHGGWARFSVLKIRLPSGQMITREVEDHGRAASVLPFDPERRMALLVRQFRAPVLVASGEEDILETIAGIVDEADPAAAAIREAEEEAGLTLRAVEFVANVYSMPGISTERMFLYLASYRASDRTGAGGGVAGEDENITVVECPLAELAAMADGGRLTDMKTFTLVQTLRLRRPELFI